jgi:hypothetical protein
MEVGQTRLSPAVEPAEVAEISTALGFRASDIVQANAVIWVEGPSDRIYIRRWMQVLRTDLVEGVHFSLLFYGGALLRHLAADDNTVSEFISLPKINRNFSVVIDSDKTGARAQVNATKKRVRQEMETGPAAGSAWITKGYTIENYVPVDLLKASVSEAHPGASCRWSGDLYTNPLKDTLIDGRKSSVDKAAIASIVARDWQPDQWPHDLKNQVAGLVDMVLAANDLD